MTVFLGWIGGPVDEGSFSKQTLLFKALALATSTGAGLGVSAGTGRTELTTYPPAAPLTFLLRSNGTLSVSGGRNVATLLLLHSNFFLLLFAVENLFHDRAFMKRECFFRFFSSAVFSEMILAASSSVARRSSRGRSRFSRFLALLSRS